MNKKLTGQILSLVKTLKSEEVETFIRRNRVNSNYLEVFNIFIKYKNSKALNIDNKIDNEAKLVKGSYNDTKEYLLKLLLEFITEVSISEDTILNKVRKLINTCRALISRKQYTLACKIAYDSFDLLDKIRVNEKSHHLYLEYLDLITEIQKGRNYDNKSRDLPENFDDEKIIYWLNTMIYVLSKSNIPIPEDIDGSFGSNLFFNLYIEYFKNKKKFNNLRELIEKNSREIISNRINKDGVSSTLELINGTYNIIYDLILLEISIKIKDKENIENLLQKIESKAHINFDGKFNLQIYIFLFLQIQNFRLNLGLDLEEVALLPKAEDIIPKISDFKLFAENEIDKTALRIEINKGILLLFSEKPEKAFKHFGAIKSNPTATPEIKFYLTLFELIAYRMDLKGYNNDSYISLIDSARNSKIKGDSYSKKFLTFLYKSIDKTIFYQNAKVFQQENTPQNTFDKILNYWLILMLNRA